MKLAGKTYRKAKESDVDGGVMLWRREGNTMKPYPVYPHLTPQYLDGALGPQYRRGKKIPYKGETLAEFQERIRIIKKLIEDKWIEVKPVEQAKLL